MIRLLIATALILAFIVIAGLQSESFSPVQAELIVEESPPLVLGINPYLVQADLEKEMQPIADYLAEYLDRPVRLNIPSDYESLGRLLEGKGIHAAWFSNVSFLQLGKGNNWEVLCRPIRRGKLVYRGLIVVKAGSPYNSLGDLRGKAFAYVDRNSGSGFYYPNQLFKKRFINPLTFFKEVVFTNSHDQSLHGVEHGHYDAASVYEDLINSGDNKEKFRIIATTSSIPNDPLVVRRALEPGLKSRLKEAMLTMHETAKGQQVLNQLYAIRGVSRYVDESEVIKVLSKSGSVKE